MKIQTTPPIAQSAPPPVKKVYMIPCPDCDHPVSPKAKSCPKCGRVLKEEQSAGGILAAVILGLIGAYLVIRLLTV